ncbi:Uncharacterised protein [uncultured archaeon]|nr:Uncharacterised protein [uncultured archaeon]
MPKKCSVCEHIQSKEINEALLDGQAYRIIAAQFGTSIASLQRHKEHLSTKMVIAPGAQDVAAANILLNQVKDLQQKSLDLLAKAEQAGDLKTALQGVREARGCLELLAKLEGQLAQEGTINITIAPEWLELRTTIMQVLEPYPEVRTRLVEALALREVQPEHAQ